MPAFAASFLMLAVVVVAYGPLLFEFAANLWAKPYYQHFPFIILASFLLTASRLSVAGQGAGPPAAASRRVYALYAVAWVILLVAYVAPSPMLAAVSLIFLLGGLLDLFCTRTGASMPVGPWLLLWLLVPPPLGLDRRLIEGLQRVSSGLASQALDLLRVDHLMDGNALVLPDKQLFVDEACSGIISVVSIVACAAIYAVWRRRAVTHALGLMAGAALWAMLLNVVRITAIALAEVWHGLDWTEGAPHTLIALAAFAGSLVALVATDWFLHAVLAEVESRRAALTSEPMRYGTSLVRLWDRLADTDAGAAAGRKGGRSLLDGGWDWRSVAAHSGAFSLGFAPVVAFAGLSAAQLAIPTGGAAPTAVGFDAVAVADALESPAMPEELLGLKRVGVERQRRERFADFGEHSVIFSYEDAASGQVYRVSCDFPFVGGWHELSTCYQGIGWRVDRRVIEDGSAAQDYERARLLMTRPDGNAALVVYSASSVTGDAIEPVRQGVLEGIARALTRRGVRGHGAPSFQAQVLVVRGDAITDRDQRIAGQLLDEARRRFASEFAALLND